jgi:outer membrane putative beta-barrel porin/alpha-amylase
VRVGFRIRTVGLVLLVALVPAPAWALNLADRFSTVAERLGIAPGTAFDALGQAIADSAARTLPVVSASAGFTYTYNPELEVFERTSQTLGPLFLERPDTLGRGKFNVNVSYEYVELNEYDGTGTDKLEASDPIIIRQTDVTGAVTGFAADRLRYRFKLINNVVGISGTYGLLDNLDLNILIPIIATSFDVGATATQVSTAPPAGTPFTPAPAPPVTAGLDDGHKNGVGDILLRAKYELPRFDIWRSALGLQFRLPSGNVNNFQGTGTFEISPFVYASTVLWGRVEPHANLGFDIDTEDAGQSQVRYGLGVDADVTSRIGVALAFLGRDQFSGIASPSETSFLHLTPSGPQPEPLLGLNFGRKDLFDFSFGARAVVWRQIMVFANGIYALNSQGLRNDTVIPTVGVEGTF